MNNNRCEICTELNTKNKNCTCKSTGLIILDITTRPTWCPKIVKDEDITLTRSMSRSQLMECSSDLAHCRVLEHFNAPPLSMAENIPKVWKIDVDGTYIYTEEAQDIYNDWYDHYEGILIQNSTVIKKE